MRSHSVRNDRNLSISRRTRDDLTLWWTVVSYCINVNYIRVHRNSALIGNNFYRDDLHKKKSSMCWCLATVDLQRTNLLALSFVLLLPHSHLVVTCDYQESWCLLRVVGDVVRIDDGYILARSRDRQVYAQENASMICRNRNVHVAIVLTVVVVYFISSHGTLAANPTTTNGETPLKEKLHGKHHAVSSSYIFRLYIYIYLYFGFAKCV